MRVIYSLVLDIILGLNLSEKNVILYILASIVRTVEIQNFLKNAKAMEKTILKIEEKLKYMQDLFSYQLNSF